MKYLILSFDDNTEHDRKVVELLNKYRLKGTFHLNSGNLNSPGFITTEELATLYKGHEIAGHTINHPRLKELTKDDIRHQIKKDIDNLAAYAKKEVRGFAYPFGDYNKKVKDVCKELGIKYSRTIKGSMSFDAPKDFLEWHPTMHFSGMAYDSSDEDRVNKGINFMFQTVEKFLDDPNGELLFIWMHSWEFKNNKDRWDLLERLFRLIAQEDEVISMTSIDYCNMLEKRNGK